MSHSNSNRNSKNDTYGSVNHNNTAIIKTDEELDIMREAGRIVAKALRRSFESLEPGITTNELDSIARSVIESEGAKPAFLGLYGFPGTACISINEEIVHGIPSDRKVQSGDIVTMDCGALVSGFYSDHAISQIVGSSTHKKQKLIDITRESLTKGIESCHIGKRVGDISNSIEKYVIDSSYELVREYVGHGIGKNLHEPPQVPNFGPSGVGVELVHGLVLAIEPMVNAGTWKTKTLDDGWTVVTEDGKLSCHFEHTVAITDNGPEILTKE